MKLTLKWLEKNNACQSGIDWYKQQGTEDFMELCKRARDAGRFDNFIWCFARRVSRHMAVEWACYCTELVLPIFEKMYPEDKRPRLAIEAARICAIKNTKKNRAYAAAAADAAYAAADAAAYAYAAAAYAAALAAAYAYAAADAAALVAAYAYAAAAVDAAARADAAAARKEAEVKIMDYGIRLLEGKT